MKKSKKELNIPLLCSGLGAVILGLILGSLRILDGFGYLIVIPLFIIGWFLVLFSFYNFFKIPTWLKITLLIVLLPLVLWIFLMLVWGITTGFTYSF